MQFFNYFNSVQFDIQIEISLLKEHFSNNLNYTFPCINDLNPIARLIDINYKFFNEHEYKPGYLLLQKDQYSFIQDGELHINNIDIEKFWQNAFLNNYSSDLSIIKLDDKVDNNTISPESSIFFCKNKYYFFHPPCPNCGNMLQLCKNDDMLSDFGLQTYTKTISRYLYCPDCIDDHNFFYSFSTNKSESPLVVGCWQLIKNYSKIVHSQIDYKAIPCVDCPNSNECYRNEYSNFIPDIIPFSFYPFYMLIFDSEALTKTEMIKLLSGVTFLKQNDTLADKHLFYFMKNNSPAPLFYDNRTKEYFSTSERKHTASNKLEIKENINKEIFEILVNIQKKLIKSEYGKSNWEILPTELQGDDQIEKRYQEILKIYTQTPEYAPTIVEKYLKDNKIPNAVVDKLKFRFYDNQLNQEDNVINYKPDRQNRNNLQKEDISIDSISEEELQKFFTELFVEKNNKDDNYPIIIKKIFQIFDTIFDEIEQVVSKINVEIIKKNHDLTLRKLILKYLKDDADFKEFEKNISLI